MNDVISNKPITIFLDHILESVDDCELIRYYKTNQTLLPELNIV